MVLFMSRAWDAVSDPLVGYLVGRSNWTPIGKLTPWLVVGAACWHASFWINLWRTPLAAPNQWWCFYLTGWFFPLRLVSSPICCCGLCREAGRPRLPACCGSSQPPACLKPSWVWVSTSTALNLNFVVFPLVLHYTFLFCCCRFIPLKLKSKAVQRCTNNGIYNTENYNISWYCTFSKR